MSNNILYEDSNIVKFCVGKGYVCIIDASLKDEVLKYKWRTQRFTKNNNVYVGCSHKSKALTLHRLLLNAPPRIPVDHKNGNSLDNRVENLRFVSAMQNSQNRKPHSNCRSPFKGVNYDPSSKVNQWRARIRVNKRLIHLGRFPSEQQAADAYDEAALVFFGEYAQLNSSHKKEGNI